MQRLKEKEWEMAIFTGWQTLAMQGECKFDFLSMFFSVIVLSLLLLLHKILFQCSFFFSFAGHKDSVTCTAFSHDSKLIATGDMSGLIIVWDVATKKQVWNFETTDLEVCKSSYFTCLKSV